MRIDLDVIQKASFERVPKKNWPARTMSDRYRIQGRVGQGKYGIVSKAQDMQTQQVVALKKINQEQEAHGFPITAMREIRLLQDIDHPNIVKLLEVVTQRDGSRDTTYLVLEYMEHDFQSLMRSVKFDFRQLKCVMKQFLDGLNYLHRQNIYHRDLKPNNILYNNRGQLKICDFGMANKLRPLQTKRIQIAQYRAPEVFLGQQLGEFYTTKVDIWSAGIFFLELCLGREKGLFSFAPTENQCFQQIMEKCGTPDEGSYPGVTRLPYYCDFVKSHHERSLRQYIHQCSNVSLEPEMVDLIDKMLVVNPDHRISAQDALNHPYFKTFPEAALLSEMPRLELECNNQTVQNIQPQKKKSSRKSKSQKIQQQDHQPNPQQQQQQQHQQQQQQQQMKQQQTQHQFKPQQQKFYQQQQKQRPQFQPQPQFQQIQKQLPEIQKLQQTQQFPQEYIGISSFHKYQNTINRPLPQIKPIFQQLQNGTNSKEQQQVQYDNKTHDPKTHPSHHSQKLEKIETKISQLIDQQPINFYCQQVVNYYPIEKPFKNPFYENHLQQK